MQHDPPTLPNLDRFAPDAANEPGAPAEPHEFGGMPTWPGIDERPRRAPKTRRSPRGYVSVTAFGISLGANVALLIGLLGLLGLGHAGVFSPGGAPGPSTPGRALGSPTTMPSPTPHAGWLQVAPSGVQLGCDDGQRRQFVVLENNGPETVRWQAAFAVPAQQAGVAISPQHGELAAGASMPLQLQNTTRASGPQGVPGQQGVIGFAPTTPDAGPPASLTYTTVGCN